MRNKILKESQIWLTQQSESSIILKAMDFAISGDKRYSFIYYVNGSDEIDNLIGKNYTDNGYISTITATLTTITMSFINAHNSKIYDQGAVHISRDSMFSFDETSNVLKQIIDLSKSKDNFRYARNMTGLLGNIATNAIEKKTAFNMTEKTGVEFNLHYYDKNSNKKTLTIFTENEYVPILRVFLNTYYKKELPPEAQNPSTDSLCYIATACYGDLYSKEVILLRKFRDEQLSKNIFGRVFIRGYYYSSNFLYKPLLKNPKVCIKIKVILNLFVKIINKKYYHTKKRN